MKDKDKSALSQNIVALRGLAPVDIRSKAVFRVKALRFRCFEIFRHGWFVSGVLYITESEKNAFGEFPIKRVYREIVVGALMNSQLLFEILIVRSVAACFFAIWPWCK